MNWKTCFKMIGYYNISNWSIFWWQTNHSQFISIKLDNPIRNVAWNNRNIFQYWFVAFHHCVSRCSWFLWQVSFTQESKMLISIHVTIHRGLLQFALNTALYTSIIAFANLIRVRRKMFSLYFDNYFSQVLH